MDQYEATFVLDAEQPVFAGHFPGHPIFPGVLTLALVRETVRQGEHRAWRLKSVARHKLVRPLAPNDEVTVGCRVTDRDVETLTLDCRLALGDGTPVASARLCLEAV